MTAIVVRNLHKSVTEEDVKALFSQFGEVAAARLAREMTAPLSKRIAYVEMPPRQAGLAIEGLNHYEFRSNELAVAPAAAPGAEVGRVLHALADRVRTVFARHA